VYADAAEKAIKWCCAGLSRLGTTAQVGFLLSVFAAVEEVGGGQPSSGRETVRRRQLGDDPC